MNARRSPLLRLPPEIRNHIYALVLGGKQIHVAPYYTRMGGFRDPKALVGENKNQLWLTICQSTQTQEEMARSNSGIIKREPIRVCNHIGCPSCADEYVDRCSDKEPISLDLSLLAVSRQIHQEASVVPFTENTFISAHPGWLACFVGMLMLPQRQAIRSISLQIWDGLRGRPHKADRARIMQLSCLRSVVLTLGIDTEIYGIEAERDMRRNFEIAGKFFERKQLKTAVICIDIDGSTPFEIPQAWLRSARETEQALLQRSRKAEA